MLDSVHQIDKERKKITAALKRLDAVEIDVKNQINFATVHGTLQGALDFDFAKPIQLFQGV